MNVSRFNSTQVWNIINVIFGIQLDKLAQPASEVSPTELELKSTEEYKYRGSPLHLYSLSQAVLKESEELVHQKEVRSSCLGFTLFWSRSILRKFCRVFSLMVSPRKISVFLFSYVFVNAVFQWYSSGKLF